MRLRAIAFISLWLMAIAGAENAPAADFSKGMELLEAKHGGRLGVVAIGLENVPELAHRGDEPFALCSTFKLLLAAAVAARVDAGKESWDRKISYSDKDLLEYAPITGKPENVKSGAMTVGDLCGAAMQWSDNTAANLLLKSLGGPEALTAFLRTLGDKTSRLDRTEPELNTNLPDDPRDTTIPRAMATTMKKLLLGDALSKKSRARLIGWMVENKTGDKRLRAGLPADWKVGDKTGTGENGAANDVAILWPPGKPPIVVAVYFSESKATPAARDEVLAEVAHAVRAAFLSQ